MSHTCRDISCSFVFDLEYCIMSAFQVAQWQRICLTMQETQEMWVQSLGWEDPLEEEMATHSRILAWTEEPGGLQPVESKSWTQLSD